MDTPIEELTLTLKIPKSIADTLRAEAMKQNISLDSLVVEAVEDYLDTPDAEIIQDIREGLREGLRGEGLSALETLAAIRAKIANEPR